MQGASLSGGSSSDDSLKEGEKELSMHMHNLDLDLHTNMQKESEKVDTNSSNQEVVIDFHTHLLPKHWPDFAARYGYGGFVSLDHEQSKVEKPGNARMMKDNQFFREIEPNCWDLETRLEEMNRDGIDVQVVCTVPVMFNYWAKADDTADMCRILNNDMAREIKRFPKRFIGLGTLPMQAPELAIGELTRCVKELKFPGVQIGSHINEWNLDAPELLPFWEAAEELGACVFIHPWDMKVTRRDRKYWMPWLVGMPAETCHAVVCVLMGGILEKFPRLKICFAHGAGAFPFTIGRIEHGYNCRPDLCATDSKQNPRQFLGQFYTDSIVHDPKSMELLVDVIGEDKVVFGTDYPFPLGEVTGSAKGVYPGKAIDDTPSLSQDVRTKIFGKNALEFLGLPLEQFICC
mmetsp:Transcript_5582/g.7067  ORF Transcript_5582/g.7067 Transcript_5582/m.7067 type:complete len:404 (-) Transcript_5582:1290-2501(-)